MTETRNEISRIFGNKLRVRVCGICFDGDSMLLVKHEPMGEMGVLWAPPGGGMTYGETAVECLEREILEESGLKVKTGKLLFVNEYFADSFHAVELFFQTEITGGELVTGKDPEIGPDFQIIKEVGFIPFSRIREMDHRILHNLFNYAGSREEIENLSGYLSQIKNIT
jgi:8-oxo-dGTP diphosphatase